MKRTIGLVAAAVVGFAIIGQAARAGSIGGPKIRDTSVSAYGADSYTLEFWAGEAARVALKGDGDTDLDLYVYDEFGNLVASDTDGSDLCAVEWYPRWTGAFRIRVVNRGPVYNEYRIITN
jgi:hypothetical protein